MRKCQMSSSYEVIILGAYFENSRLWAFSLADVSLICCFGDFQAVRVNESHETSADGLSREDSVGITRLAAEPPGHQTFHCEQSGLNGVWMCV